MRMAESNKLKPESSAGHSIRYTSDIWPWPTIFANMKNWMKFGLWSARKTR